jgi:hypothetical protein
MVHLWYEKLSASHVQYANVRIRNSQWRLHIADIGSYIDREADLVDAVDIFNRIMGDHHIQVGRV